MRRALESNNLRVLIPTVYDVSSFHVRSFKKNAWYTWCEMHTQSTVQNGKFTFWCKISLVSTESQSVTECCRCCMNYVLQHIASNGNCCTEMLWHPTTHCDPCRRDRKFSATLCDILQLNGNQVIYFLRWKYEIIPILRSDNENSTFKITVKFGKQARQKPR